MEYPSSLGQERTLSIKVKRNRMAERRHLRNGRFPSSGIAWVVGILAAGVFGCAATRSKSQPQNEHPGYLLNSNFSLGGGMTGRMPGVGLHWQTTDGAAHLGWYNLDRQIFLSPPASQRMTCSSTTANPWGTIWQTTPHRSVTPGREYEASVWCRTSGFEDSSFLWGGLRLAIRFMDSEKNVLSESRAPLDICEDHGWRRISVRARAPENASCIQFLIYLRSEAGTVWYDDAEIHAIGEGFRELSDSRIEKRRMSGP
jgi:hypothetical protein